MNILMALSQLEVTGAEVYATEIGNELEKRGHKLFYVSDTLTKEVNGEYFPLSFNKRNPIQRINHIIKLIKIIKENKIQVVHAHSRASAWSCEIACKIMKIPFFTTTHGKQHKSQYRKRHQPIGRGFAVCENILEDLVHTFGVERKKISLLRNAVDPLHFETTLPPKNEKKIISIIGRLSGPKADIVYNLLSQGINLNKYKILVIGGKEVPARFNIFKNRVEFTGYVDNVHDYMAKSDLVIGAGRVAIESLLMGRPTLAIGEALEVGIVSESTIDLALESNFGDISLKDSTFINWNFVKNEVEKGVEIKQISPELQEKVREAFNLNKIISFLEKSYQDEYVRVKGWEIPILMYHRVIDDSKIDEGKHGTSITASLFRKHMEAIKEKGLIPITFKDLLQINPHNRFNEKYIILTFDDGYVDNYEVALPILKEFNFKAIVYLVSNRSYNKWDVDLTGEKQFDLMDSKMVKKMINSGLIEIGGHTLSHLRLSELPLEEAKREIFDDKKITEQLYKTSLLSFAYPYGDLNEEVKEIVKEAGYTFGVATDSGSPTISDDLFQIRRIAIFPGTSKFSLKRKISGAYNFLKIKRKEKKS